MSVTSKAGKLTAASFGAAMGAMYFSPSLDADIVDLTGSLPGTLSSAQQSFDFIGGGSFDWLQWNDGAGRSVTAAGYLNGLIQISVSNVLTAGAAFVGSLVLPATISGLNTFGFVTNTGQLGWIQIDYNTGGTSPITYVAAAFEQIPGNPIHVGTLTSTPEPNAFGLGALATLALGATRRKKRQAQEPR